MTSKEEKELFSKLRDSGRTYPDISLEEERDLIRLAKGGDLRARQALLFAFMSVARILAAEVTKAHNRYDFFDDCVQYALVEIDTLIQKFDLKTKYRFATYISTCIRRDLAKKILIETVRTEPDDFERRLPDENTTSARSIRQRIFINQLSRILTEDHLWVAEKRAEGLSNVRIAEAAKKLKPRKSVNRKKCAKLLNETRRSAIQLRELWEVLEKSMVASIPLPSKVKEETGE